jgi:phosphate-selective porin OprO/OprP
LFAGASVIAVLAISAPASAQDNQAVQEQIKALQAQINSLQRQVEQAQSAAASQKSGGDDLDLKVKWKGAPGFSSSDGKF